MGITTTSCSLTGRDTEIRALDGLLSAGRHHFVAVLLRGDAGVGKAALLEMASDRAEAEGARVFTALVMTRGAPERSQGLPVRIAIEEKLGAGFPAANSLLFGFGGPPGRTSWL